MRPALAFPYNDPNGMLFPHLQAILPDLKLHFEHAYICPPLSTQKQMDIMKWLQADGFFTVFPRICSGQQSDKLRQERLIVKSQAQSSKGLHAILTGSGKIAADLREVLGTGRGTETT